MRIVFFPYLNNLGHVVPSLALAEQLRERGHEVSFRGEGIFADVVREAGFPLAPVFTFSDAFDRRNEEWMTQWTAEVVERSIESERRALAEDEPDVVVADLRPTLGISARVHGVPQVSLLCADWTNYYDYPKALIETERALGRKWGRRLARVVAPVGRHLVLQHAARHLRRAYREHGVELPGQGNLFDAWTGDLNLLNDIPTLAPLRPGAPASFRYVGPTLRGVVASSPAAKARIDPTRPLIYVTLGSSGIRRGEPSVLYVAEALGGRPEQVFMTTGGQCEIPDSLPENLIVTETDDGMELCARACLTICKGGSGTVYQSLAAGTPILSIPRNHNQFFVSERVERAGAGIMACDGIDQATFVRLVDQARADPGLRRRAQELGREIRELAAEARAVHWIESLVS